MDFQIKLKAQKDTLSSIKVSFAPVFYHLQVNKLFLFRQSFDCIC